VFVTLQAVTGAAAEEASFRYRPGLDGLRALAVAAVILYHGQVSWAKGGFLGVDVFFVLSGYLITSLLLTERENTGGVDLKAFWTRRARRLLPALFLLLVGVAIYAVVWAQPAELGTIRGDGFATLLYVSNWRFIFDGSSYFQAFQAPSPLAHTWSLAIEEQWYLLWPIALLILMRIVRASTKVFAAVLVGLTLCSAALMAILFHPGADPSRVYYGTDTRAQALLVGATFAALTAGRHPALRLDRLRRPWLLQTLGIIGAVLVGWMVVRADAQGAFLYRGGFLLAAIAAVLFVASATVDGLVASVLSIRPLVAIGAISYGLYLWHWPVDVVLDENRTGLTAFALFAARIAVTGVIATASYLVVERPIRRNGLAAFGSRVRAPRRLRPAIVAVAAGAVAILLALSTAGAVPAPNLASLANAHQLSQRHSDPRQARVLMVGDSQMFTLVYYGDAAFNAAGPRYSYAPIIGCGIFDPSVHLGGNCNERLPRWRQQIRLFNPDLSVVLIGAWESLDFTVKGHTYVHATPEHERELARIFASALRTLTARGGRVALLQVPCMDENQGDNPTMIHDRNLPASITNVNQALEAVARRDPKQISFVRWADAICPGGKFVAKINGITVRPDGVHYATHAGAEIATDKLAPILSRLAVEAHDARARKPVAAKG
jgi:peptidoglycan/LPS O-acetylase OafA/YrhL